MKILRRLKNYCWLFLWIFQIDTHNRRVKYHAYDGLKGKNDIDRIFVFSFAQSKTCSTIFLFFFYYLLILLCIQVHYGQKNEFALHNSHIPQLNAYCKIAFFVQQIFVVGLVHLYTEYRCQLPSVYYLTTPP